MVAKLDFRRRKAKRYFATLGVVVAAFLAYSLIAVPWIEGPERIVSVEQPADDFDLAQFKSELVMWLPEDAWERQSCKQISTRSGHLFFQKYEPNEDGSLVVRPLTIILPQADAAADKPPMVLRAPDGAILKLDQPLALGAGDAQLESAQLPGPVTLTRAAVLPDRSDEWLIQTSQIRIDKQRMQTIQEVDFRIGQQTGHGRNLVIEFDADPLRAQQPAMNGIRGVRKVELVQVDRLHLTPIGKSEATGAKGATAASPSEPNAASEYPRGFDVSFNGPFEFDLTTKVATLNGGVRIVSSDHADDWLTADQIALQFGSPPPADDSAATDQPEGLAANDREWALRRMVASGQPAVLHSQARQLHVRGQQLSYDLGRQEIGIGGTERMEVRQANMELSAAGASYQLSADGSLGRGLVSGPGRVRREAAGDQPAFDIRWRDRLTIGADAAQKLITVEGDAYCHLDGQAQFAAEKLQIWLWELPLAPADLPASNVVATDPLETPRAAPAAPSWSLHPNRLAANGRVRIESERVSVHVDDMQVAWPYPETPAQAAVGALPARNASALIERDGQESKPQNAGEGDASAACNENKVEIEGRSAEVQMAADAGAFRDVVIEGNVHVRQSSPLGAVPLDITGDRLRIAPQADQRYRLAVSGSPTAPSRIQAERMQLVGATVHLDQSANRLWIDGPGTLRAEMAPQTKPVAEASSVNAPWGNGEEPAQTTVDVEWSGGMVFDGRQVYLETGVKMGCDQLTAAGSSRIDAHCAAINLSLNTAVDLAGGTANAPAVEPQVELITLIGQVIEGKRVFDSSAEPSSAAGQVGLERRSYDLNRELISVQSMAAPWGQVNAISGELNMSGPGSVALWQYSAGLQPAGAEPARAQTGPPQLTNTQVRFETSLTGNLRRSEIKFAGKVRTLHGPVADWNQSLDADQPALNQDDYRLKSDQLQITQWQRSSEESAHLEIIALGQAQLEGQTFEALAERIGYNQSQEKVILEGDPRNGAQLTYQTAPGGPRNPLVASKIAFNLRDNTTQVEGFKHGVLTTGPILKKR